ncbi:MAG: HDIG domain-containing protein [Bacteroidetes bacterium]|nr:HDIG domain-containing protein [Bacteroidota bacterium]
MTEKFRTVLKKFKGLVNLSTVVAVAVLISFLYPGSVKFKYEFQRGQVWRYDDLTASFDFPIKKTAAELGADKALMVKEFSPFYTFNAELTAAKISDIKAAAEALPALPGDAKTASKLASAPKPPDLAAEGARILERIYKKGIVQLAPEHQGAGDDFVINVVQGNTSFKRTLPGFFTLETAREELAADITKLKPAPSAAFPKALEDALVPNITFDADRSETLLNEALSAVSALKGLVSQGDLVVKKGNVVTDETYEKLVSYREKFQSDVSSQKSEVAVYFGYLLLTSLMLAAFMMYVNAYRREILANWNYLAFVLLWLLGFSYLTHLVERTAVLSVYVIPYCVVPVVVRHFFSYRLAFFTHVIVLLIAGFLTSEGFQFLFTQIVAGVVAVLAVADARAWSKFFRSVLSILLAYSMAHVGLSLIEEGSFRQIDMEVFGWLAFNGLLTLLAFPLIPLTERLFGFTSAISLVELSDMNRPLLKELALKAPGTFQHSLQVGNLAEAAANEIGAEPLLLRVGALYHDIGKMLNPDFFVENLSGSSPHEGLSRLESAKIIIAHVPDGEKMAKKNRLPAVLTRFITTHHGTTKVEYFYKNYVQENPDVEVDASKFTYPGPLPRTKEEAILMLADSVEATSRVLKDPTGQDIDRLVDKVFKSKIDQGQLNESKLTFGELEKSREVYKKMLRSIRHVRIEYPE